MKVKVAMAVAVVKLDLKEALGIGAHLARGGVSAATSSKLEQTLSSQPSFHVGKQVSW